MEKQKTDELGSRGRQRREVSGGKMYGMSTGRGAGE